MRKAILIAGLGLAIAAAGVATWLAVDAKRPATATASRDVHTFLHINCKHHNHGPAWHKDHGRILGAEPTRNGEVPDREPDAARRR